MERVPGSDELPMLDLYLPMMKVAAVLSADELGLFRALGDGARAEPELASALGAEPGALTRLCDLLVAVGYLARDERGRVGNTAFSQRWLSGRGAHDYGPGLAWTRASWTMMPGLTEAVRRGGPRESLWALMEQQPALGPLFSRYMRAFAGHLGEELQRLVTPPEGPARLLDLGGSHGLHTIGLLQRAPELQATIVDWPASLTDTPAALAAAGLGARVELRPGDLRTVEWGGPFDLVLYLSVAHNQSAEENAAIFRRIGAALRPGGRLVVHEYLADPPLPAYDAAFRLTLLTETGTRTWSTETLTRWCVEAGLSAPVRLALQVPEKGALLVARRDS